MSDIELTPAPVVTTEANPKPEWLLRARAWVQENPSVQGLFRQWRQDLLPLEWLEDRVITLLNDHWGDAPEEAHACGCYLAAEWAQIPSPVLVDPLSGRAISLLPEHAFYQPEPVLREDGRLVERAVDLKPELKAQLILADYNKARESDLLVHYQDRIHQTELLAVEGDSRLEQVTRQGRKSLGERILATPPDVIMKALKGRYRRAWAHFSAPQESSYSKADITLTGRLVKSMHDAYSVNVYAGGYQSLLCSIGNQWLDGLIRNWLDRLPATPIGSVQELTNAGGGCWLGSSDLLPRWPDALLGHDSRAAYSFGRVGVSSLVATSGNYYELSDIWHLDYQVTATLWWDPAEVACWSLPDRGLVLTEIVPQ